MAKIKKISKRRHIKLERKQLAGLIALETFRFCRSLYSCENENSRWMDHDDILQEAHVQLLEAIDDYSIHWKPKRRKFKDGKEVKNRKPSKFITFYVHKLRNRFRFISLQNLPVDSLDDRLFESWDWEGEEAFPRKAFLGDTGVSKCWQEIGITCKELEKALDINFDKLVMSPKILKGEYRKQMLKIIESLMNLDA